MSRRALPFPFLPSLALWLALAFPALAAGDLLLDQQWGLAKIQAQQAWAKSRGAGVVVAIVDTGVDFAHPDLAGKAAGSFDCRSDPCTPGGSDDNGHGTWVAGVVGAVTGNGAGIAGVAPDAKIMSIKVLDASGSGTSSSVARGIRWAADHGARVINLSLSPDLPLVPALLNVLGLNSDLQGAIDHAATRGALVVAAAGNNSFPISSNDGLPNLLLVGATGPDDEVAGYSAGARLYAPGGAGQCPDGREGARRCIATTDRTTDGDGVDYRAVQGTSFAAPHVSGVAALLMSVGLPYAEAARTMQETADKVSGVLRVNAARALEPFPALAPPPPGGGPAVSGGPGSVPGAAKPAPKKKSLPGPATLASTPTPSPTPTPIPDEATVVTPTVEPSPPPPYDQAAPAPGATGRSERSPANIPSILASALVVSTAAANGGYRWARRRRAR